MGRDRGHGERVEVMGRSGGHREGQRSRVEVRGSGQRSRGGVGGRGGRGRQGKRTEMEREADETRLCSGLAEAGAGSPWAPSPSSVPPWPRTSTCPGL